MQQLNTLRLARWLVAFLFGACVVPFSVAAAEYPDRPVRRSPRNASSNRHMSSPSSRMTISRSENDV